MRSGDHPENISDEQVRGFIERIFARSGHRIALPSHSGRGRRFSAAHDAGSNFPTVKATVRVAPKGNPKGRKKGAKGIKTIVREVATERRPVRTAHGTRHMTTAEIIIHKAMEQAMKGNQRAVQLMLSLYQDAVPDRVEEAAIDAPEDLSATDMAMLEAFIAMTRNDPRGASA